MPRPYTPRSAIILFAVGLLLVLLAGLAFATDQPIGLWNLALGAAMGLNSATVVMVYEVRKARGE